MRKGRSFRYGPFQVIGYETPILLAVLAVATRN